MLQRWNASKHGGPKLRSLEVKTRGFCNGHSPLSRGLFCGKNDVALRCASTMQSLPFSASKRRDDLFWWQRFGCPIATAVLAAWQLGSTTTMAMHRRRSLVPPRCCSLVQPPPQPCATAAVASCRRRCSLVPPLLLTPLQPCATAAAALCHRRWYSQAPR